ncbi:hypothetical protein ACPRNU_09145 [Chromobacterium vaccinii]|uniref:hypothetical protein n=1 Tax=Chromobacterium vaccinii TaxID=1108595 RepID=UPI003C7368C2
MRRFVAVLSLLLAGGACASGPSALAGHYYLQGVTEVGGELLLKPDGSFEWGLSYGAVDQYAQGHWQLRQGKVELNAAGPDKEPVFRPFRDEEMRVRRPAEPGHWIAIVGMPGVGPMQGVEVGFVSRSGKTATAVTDANGDAGDGELGARQPAADRRRPAMVRHRRRPGRPAAGRVRGRRRRLSGARAVPHHDAGAGRRRRLGDGR